MKKLLSSILLLLIFYMYSGLSVMAANPNPNMPRPKQPNLQAAPNAKTIELAFVFDGPSDKNAEVLGTFQKVITMSLLPDFKASFPNDLVFTGDWTEKGAKAVSDKALASRARMIISLGFMSSDYYADKPNKQKYVVTIDQYGLRDFGDKFFNPVQQSVNDFVTFQALVPGSKKTAVLMNENYYNMHQDWNAIIKKRLAEKNCNIDFALVPVNSDVKSSLSKMPNDVDSVFVTPLFNLTQAQRKEVYQYINGKKLPSYSTVGKEDVALGAMLGTSTFNVDKKLAEATSFNIHGVLHGMAVKEEKIPFYDDKILFYNSDAGETIGYTPPLRLLNNCMIISNKELPKYTLGSLLDALDEGNLDMKRKNFLVDAARRSVASAYLRYLPTLRVDLGYQTYNKGYAYSYADVPDRVGLFTVGIDQVIYSPDLVTNIIVKHKKLKFDKAENALTKATTELNTAFLYVDALMLENAIKIQTEELQETRENLAMARVRQKTGKCGNEEIMRWAGQVSEEEKKLLGMQAELKNIKIHVNKLLNKDQKQDFAFAPLTASDPSFFSSDVHIIDHVRDPKKLGKFTDMLVEEVKYMSPETVKLKAAIAMKKAEMANYGQKFFPPNAKLTLEHSTQFARHLPYEEIGHKQMQYVGTAAGAAEGANTAAQAILAGGVPAEQQAGALAQGIAEGYAFGAANSPWLGLDKNSTRFMIAAQWKPIEGGHKIAEIARCKAELNELNAYLEEVNTTLEMTIREVVNRAISKYFMIEKSYKALFAEAENYQMVKARYLVGKAPINQLVDAQDLYFKAKIEAINSQYEFFRELLWVQRALLSVNWAKANKEAKDWMLNVPKVLPEEEDFVLSL